MEDGWRWLWPKIILGKSFNNCQRKNRVVLNLESKLKINLKKEVKKYELWRIWWSICATKFKRKIK